MPFDHLGGISLKWLAYSLYSLEPLSSKVLQIAQNQLKSFRALACMSLNIFKKPLFLDGVRAWPKPSLSMNSGCMRIISSAEQLLSPCTSKAAKPCRALTASKIRTLVQVWAEGRLLTSGSNLIVGYQILRDVTQSMPIQEIWAQQMNCCTFSGKIVYIAFQSSFKLRSMHPLRLTKDLKVYMYLCTALADWSALGIQSISKDV